MHLAVMSTLAAPSILPSLNNADLVHLENPDSTIEDRAAPHHLEIVMDERTPNTEMTIVDMVEDTEVVGVGTGMAGQTMADEISIEVLHR